MLLLVELRSYANPFTARVPFRHLLLFCKLFRIVCIRKSHNRDYNRDQNYHSYPIVLAISIYDRISCRGSCYFAPFFVSNLIVAINLGDSLLILKQPLLVEFTKSGKSDSNNVAVASVRAEASSVRWIFFFIPLCSFE